MSITLSDTAYGGSTSVALHKDLYWTDEFNWFPVEQTKQFTVSGALIVMSAERKAGRHITLEPEDDSSAWMTYDTVSLLKNFATVPGKVMTLTLRGLTHKVMFRHEDGGFEAIPIKHQDDLATTDFYRCTVRLLEIQ